MNNFFERFSECKDYNRTRGVKRYYENEDERNQINKKYIRKKTEMKHFTITKQ